MSTQVSEVATAGISSLFVLETGISVATTIAAAAPYPSGHSFAEWAESVVASRLPLA